MSIKRDDAKTQRPYFPKACIYKDNIAKQRNSSMQSTQKMLDVVVKFYRHNVHLN